MFRRPMDPFKHGRLPTSEPGNAARVGGTVGALTGLLAAFFLWLPVVSAQPNDQPLELRVVDVSGKAEIRSDTETSWEPVRPGQAVSRGDRLRTGAGDTVALADTGAVSVASTDPKGSMAYFELAPRGTLTVGRLRREVWDATDDRLADTGLANEVRFKALQGALRIYLRSGETIRHDFRLETVNAAVGVRGTTFQCDSKDGTSCTVLEGNVRFASRSDTGDPIILSAGDKSTLAPDAVRPRQPSTIGARTRRALRRFRNRARGRICSVPLDELLSR